LIAGLAIAITTRAITVVLSCAVRVWVASASTAARLNIFNTWLNFIAILLL
jgi:hypothetical protein